MTYLKIKDETMLMTVSTSSPTTLHKMSQDQFYEFCRLNPDLRVERTAQGEVIVMPPTFADTGNRNFKIAVQLGIWSEQDGTGDGFDSSAGFTLPNGATRSFDVAWMKLDRWNALTDQQKASFSSICPDFVVELRSASSLSEITNCRVGTAHEGFQSMYNCLKSRFWMMSNHIDARWWAVPTLLRWGFTPTSC
jgi:Uma2 family endonuclease